MIKVLFSIITDYCFILLFENEKVISEIKEYNAFLHSEKFVHMLDQILFEKNFSLVDVEEIYFISGFSNQTGDRVSNSFVTAMSIVSNNIKIFSIDGFTFQKGELENCLSVISFGKREKKYWLVCYENNQIIYRDKASSFDQINLLNTKKFEIVHDFNGVNFSKNFFLLKEKFKKFES